MKHWLLLKLILMKKEFNKNMKYFYRNTRIKLVIIFDKDYRCSKASNYLKIHTCLQKKSELIFTLYPS